MAHAPGAEQAVMAVRQQMNILVAGGILLFITRHTAEHLFKINYICSEILNSP